MDKVLEACSLDPVGLDELVWFCGEEGGEALLSSMNTSGGESCKPDTKI